ncbi:MAG: hypothetical protein GY714_26540, partial [Desulfobacterales bacterium]|nr:hypothetical protein [Desulfobacterales bacterium]
MERVEKEEMVRKTQVAAKEQLDKVHHENNQLMEENNRLHKRRRELEDYVGKVQSELRKSEGKEERLVRAITEMREAIARNEYAQNDEGRLKKVETEKKLSEARLR